MRGGKNFIDITGRVYGRLTVLARLSNVNGRVVYSCFCECGNMTDVSAQSLKNGKTKSCGCLRRDYMRKKATKHGYYYEPLRAVWSQMRQRCLNINNKDFYYYGSRGIKICNDWNEYLPFRSWALEAGYQPGLTIDRIDSNGNYYPINCRWITIQEQQKNRRPKK